MTPLYPIFRQRINDAYRILADKQVEPWFFLTAGPPFKVSKFDGKAINYQGIGYEGSPQLVFWDQYIEPFIENLCIREIDAAVKMAKEQGVAGYFLLEELRPLLISGATNIYQKMAEIDRRLRGKGYPQQIPMRSIEREVREMTHFINERIDAEISMFKPELSRALIGDNSAISAEGRKQRFAQWEALGVERVKADLQSGGMKIVGGTADVQNLAWEWVHSKEHAIITDIVRQEISQAVIEIKAELKILTMLNAMNSEVHCDIQQIEVELQRPEPRRNILKVIFEGLLDHLLKIGGEKAAEVAVKVGKLVATYFGIT